LACELFMELSGQCRLCCRRIDGRYVADLHLSTCFPPRSPVKIFWSKNRLFPPLPRIYAKCERQAWESYFLPKHNFIAHQEPANSATGSRKSVLTSDGNARNIILAYE